MRRALVLLCPVAVAGCEAILFSDATERGSDAGPDVAVDSSADAGGPDTGADARADALADAGSTAPSCNAWHLRDPKLPSGVYLLDPDDAGPTAPFKAYCDMTSSGGGWTLLLKIDGNKTTFLHDAELWTNTTSLVPESTDLSETESKNPGFSSVSFSRIRLGMKRGLTHFIEFDAAASSLRALFAGPTVTTTLGRSAWLSLLDGAEVQANCNREGVNVKGGGIGARIGLLANEQNDCFSPDSFIGVGGLGNVCGAQLRAATCYESKACGAPGDRDLVAFAYVLVR